MPYSHFALLASLLVILLPGILLRAEPPKDLFHESDVRAILKIHCWHCHGEESEHQAKLDLRLVRTMFRGGENGSALVPGQSDASLLWTKIESGEMPPKGKGLTDAEKAIVRQWIDQGARTLRDEPESIDSTNPWTIEEQNHWSFQPVTDLIPPVVRESRKLATAIDNFVLSKLEEKGLSFSPSADRATLLRRLTFDLHGLPPTQQQIEQFLNDPAPDAYERLVDRLLAAPAYGERWGRHWLDVAGYADSDGYTEEDRERAWVFRYRDYVIDSLNADKPFDQFVIEQLAGDELVKHPYNNLSPVDAERLTATGFLRLAPDGTGQGEADPKVTRNDMIAETIKVATSSLLGLTVGCAQCHNHRYDPISQTDYFRVRALFEPALDCQNWRDRPARLISLWQEEERKRAQEVDQELAQIEGKRVAELDQIVNEVFEKEVAKLPTEQHELARTARTTPADKRTEQQLAILKDHPSLNVDRGSVYLYEPARTQEFNKKYEAIVAEAKNKRPAESYIDAFTEAAGQIPKTHLLSRGDPNQPREEVLPGDLSIFQEQASILPDDPEVPTSGRRLAFAKHITSGKHPLLGRVIANRLWLHHFGQGIVATPNDFGFLGDRPSHPELLDWLATELARSNWSLKHLHRLIICSTTYRQSASRTPELDAIDPENRLFGRMNIRRLEAEAIRDAMIESAGLTVRAMFGPAETVNPDDVGQVIIGKATRDGNGILVAKWEETAAQYRRSVYLQVRRSLPLGVLEPFDLPTLVPNCDRRNFSTVAPQALLMMNNRQTVLMSEKLAQRLLRDVPNQSPSPTKETIAEQVKRGWLLVFGKVPSDRDEQQAVALIEQQLSSIQAQVQAIAEGKLPKESRVSELSPEVESLALYCQALFSANRFLYVD